jgi:hypothetical protein
MADCSLASPHQPTPGRAGGDIALLNQPTGQGGLGPLAALAQRLIATPQRPASSRNRTSWMRVAAINLASTGDTTPPATA